MKLKKSTILLIGLAVAMATCLIIDHIIRSKVFDAMLIEYPTAVPEMPQGNE